MKIAQYEHDQAGRRPESTCWLDYTRPIGVHVAEAERCRIPRTTIDQP
jgi:hypothetical protein